jgi:DNA-binding transcriptional regulator YiaG
MGISKYHSGVSIGKGVKIANQRAKLSPGQNKFAHRLVRTVKKWEGTK